MGRERREEGEEGGGEGRKAKGRTEGKGGNRSSGAISNFF